MIESIEFLRLPRDPSAGSNDQRHGEWALDLPAIAERDGVVRFRPGLNVLFGPNGCGKSTILRTIAVHMMAHSNGETTLTQDSVREMMGREAMRTLRRGAGSPTPVAAKVRHDGQPIRYATAGKLMFGVDRSFDTDFMDAYGAADGIVPGARGSHGSRSLAINQLVMRTLLGRSGIAERPVVARDMRRESVNDVWQRMYDVAMGLLEPSIDKGQTTVVLDEPDAHLSLVMQARIWRDVLGRPEVAERHQVIVATHSPFALAVPHAHVIGMPDDYVAACRSELADLAQSLAPEAPEGTRP